MGLEAHENSDPFPSADTLREHLGHDTDADRSEVLWLAIRAGLQTAAPEVVDAAGEARAEHAKNRPL